jgi:hypothetical protein
MHDVANRQQGRLYSLYAFPRPEVARLIFLARPPPSFGANEAPALSSVPAEVAAPSKRGPSAFILAPLIELSSASLRGRKLPCFL